MLSSFDWIRVWEIFLGAALAFIFGGVLQWRLMVRQERFQEKMEARRDEQEDKAEKRRIAEARRNTSDLVETSKLNAMNERIERATDASRSPKDPRRS